MKNGHLTTEDVKKLLKENRGWSAFSPETLSSPAYSANIWLLDEPLFLETSTGGARTPGELGTVNNWYVWDKDGKPVRFMKRKPESKPERSLANVPERILVGHRLLWSDALLCYVIEESKEGSVILRYDERNSGWMSFSGAPVKHLVAAVEVSKRIDQWLAGEID